jgi:hypothetical protein
LDDDPAYWRAKLETAKTALKRSEASAKAGDWKMALSWQEGAFTMAHGLLDKMRRTGAKDSEPAPPYAPGDLIKLPSGKIATVTKCLLGENLFREKEWHVSTRTGEIVAVPVRGGARDIAPVDVGDDFTPHRFEPMPGNRKNQPCNRCLEFKAHPNHDLTAEREARLKETTSPWMKAEVRKGIELAKRELAAMGTARDIAPVVMGKDVVCRECGNTLTAVGPGSGLCTACAAARGEPLADPAGRDARRARLHRALDAVMDGVKAKDDADWESRSPEERMRAYADGAADRWEASLLPRLKELAGKASKARAGKYYDARVEARYEKYLFDAERALREMRAATNMKTFDRAADQLRYIERLTK